MNLQWLLGFIEGEGSFMIAYSRKYNAFQPCFKLGLHFKDKIVLDEIQNFLKIGKVKFKKPQKISHSPQYLFEIKNLKDCIILRDLLINQDFQTKKKEDFDKWSYILDLMKEKRHLNYEIKNKILNIRSTMNLKGINETKSSLFIYPDYII